MANLSTSQIKVYFSEWETREAREEADQSVGA